MSVRWFGSNNKEDANTLTKQSCKPQDCFVLKHPLKRSILNTKPGFIIYHL
jgi:hypothetical protein